MIPCHMFFMCLLAARNEFESSILLMIKSLWNAAIDLLHLEIANFSAENTSYYLKCNEKSLKRT